MQRWRLLSRGSHASRVLHRRVQVHSPGARGKLGVLGAWPPTLTLGRLTRRNSPSPTQGLGAAPAALV